MNQVSRKNAKTSVKKNFYKLMNNSNSGYNCRSNTENYFFAPIFDELEELSYTKRYQNPFDHEISEFVSSDQLEREINETIDNKIATLDQNQTLFEGRIKFFGGSKKTKPKFGMKKTSNKTMRKT